MFYRVLIHFKELHGVFNVFRYITVRSGLSGLTALLASMILGFLLIKRLRKFKISQKPLEDKRHPILCRLHRKKWGVPTMGGLLILGAIFLASLLWADLNNRYVQLILLATFWLGGLGFIDDFLKIRKKRTEGLRPLVKLGGQIALGLVIGFYLFYHPLSPEYGTLLPVPFLKNFLPDLGWLYIPFTILVIVASCNAVNLTDGLDGLAIGSLVIAGGAFAGLCYVTGHGEIARYLNILPMSGAGELTIFCSALVGAGLGFLWFNAYPAQVIMGDTGSLALGGALGTIAILIKKELVLLIVGGLFVLEALSVIIQVTSYKLTKKRVFLMTPLHHHLELLGWKESKIVIRLWIIAVIFALLSLGTLKLR
jgi:phospho-N-acetylmuramoyl-pentapeptide-transferase